MDREELIEFLRNNLTLDHSKEGDWGYGGSRVEWHVIKLKLGNETLSEIRIDIEE